MATATKNESPSTAIAVIKTDGYLALQEGGAIAEAMEANMGADAALRESDLTRVPIPTGGGTMWLVPTIGDDKAVKSIDGILVAMCLRGLLWAGDEPEEGSLPVLVSHDLKTARLVAAENVDAAMLRAIEPAKMADGRYDWSKLPQNEWGTGKKGHGKAAKEQRVLYVLPADEPLPVVVIIQPGSLKDWQKFVVSLTKAGIPYYRAVVSLTLEKDTAAEGQPFARVVPKLIGTISEAEGKVIRVKFTEPMKAVAACAFAG